MSVIVTQPFLIFYDRAGEPLENGYIYIGLAGTNPEANPITVYWDASLTTTAAQPIRTLAGYPSRNGSPSNIIASQSPYSILIKDKTGTLVYSNLNFSEVESDTPETVQDIASLRLLSSGTVKDQVILIQNYVAGDGGGVFRYDSTDTITADNGGTVIVDAAGRRWKRQYSGAVDVTWFGARGDGTTDDTTAIHNARTASGVGGGVYFPGDKTYIVAGVQANIDDQTWIVESGSKLKMKPASILNMLVVSGDRFKFSGELDGNYTNAPSGGMIVVDVDVIRPEFDVYCYNSSSYSIYAANVGDIQIKGRFGYSVSSPIFIRLLTPAANYEGPKIDAEFDLSSAAVGYNHPAIIVRGIEGGGYRFDNVDVRARMRLRDDPTNSTALGLEVKAANNLFADLLTEDGAMSLSMAEVTSAGGTVVAKGFGFYGIEFGGGCVDCHFNGVLDGRDAAGSNQCLYPLAFQGSPSGGVGYNKNCSFVGQIHGATSSQSILFDNCVDCKFEGVVNCGASNYVAYDDGQGYFSISGIFNGETGGDLLVYSLNSTGRFTVSGRAKAFDNGGVQIDANTAVTIDYISVSVVYEDANGGGFTTNLSGGAALGEHVSAQNCVGQLLSGSTYRSQILNLKRAVYNIEGTGSPEGVVTAGVGSVYQRADGADGSSLYIKSTGTGNTGWDAIPYYEQGTFSADVTFATPGDLSVTYSNQTGNYTRVGNRVEVSVILVFTPTFTTASGALRIGNMPFTIASAQDTAGTIRDITSVFTWPASRTQLVVYPNSSTNYLTIQGIGSGQNPSDISASNMTSGASHILRFSVSYRI